MAVVWRGTDLGRRRPVALKRIRANGRDPSDARALFDDEIRVTASVRHPRIVGYIDHGRDDEGPWLALDWIDGPDCLTLLKARAQPLPIEAVLALGEDLLDALGGLHAPPFAMVHRDVAPANVIVDVHGRAFLTDLGIARDLSRPRAKSPGVARGKLGYLAPEVLRGAVHGVRADLYGAGLVLWEMLAGRRVFSHLPAGETRTWHFAYGERPPLREVVASAPPRVAAVIDASLALTAAPRAQNAAVFRQQLREAARRDGVAPSRLALAECVRAVYSPSEPEPIRRRAQVRTTILSTPPPALVAPTDEHMVADVA